ncbi:hypothetical protein [Asaia platycodi]|uniref:hypothetical protein n=1 Tax=Asaia platycodi TaxID=610243 RepID=UPI0004710623|nr:hypothetical protein [Asaia platycodi]
MAKLSAFSRDAARVQEGETIEVGPVGNTFLVTTRGFTPRYRDALFTLKSEAASRLNRSLQPGAHDTQPKPCPRARMTVCRVRRSPSIA